MTNREVYFDFVFNYGFTATKQRINKLIQTRWSILGSFSKVTTHRLQEIRKLNPAYVYKKKALVTNIELAELISKRNEPVKKFAGELRAVLDFDKDHVLMKKLANEYNLSWGTHSLDDYLTKLSVFCYNRMDGREITKPLVQEFLKEDKYIKLRNLRFESVRKVRSTLITTARYATASKNSNPQSILINRVNVCRQISKRLKDIETILNSKPAELMEVQEYFEHLNLTVDPESSVAELLDLFKESTAIIENVMSANTSQDLLTSQRARKQNISILEISSFKKMFSSMY